VVTYDIVRQGSLAGRVEQGAHRLGIRWFDSLVAARSLWTRYVVGGVQRFGVRLIAVPVGLVGIWLPLAPGLVLRRLSLRQRVGARATRSGQRRRRDPALSAHVAHP